MNFLKNVVLKNYTTYKIGGKAKHFFEAKTKEELAEALAAAKKQKLEVFILGGGSNILVADKGVDGLVVRMAMNELEAKKGSITCGAGVMLPKLVKAAADGGFTGFEWAAGVPGTVGGAVYGHAQAFGDKISDSVKKVVAMDVKTLKIKTFTKKQCQFALKNSVFKKKKRYAILSVEFAPKTGYRDAIKKKIKQNLALRKKGHPMEWPSCGSTFVNPEVKIKNKQLLEKFPELVGFSKAGVIPSGYLIAKSGLSGIKIGGAEISQKHANFLINTGNAKASDVVKLIKLAQKKVKKTFGISIVPEVQFVNIKF